MASKSDIYTVVATDVDGTLCQIHEIHDDTHEAIKKCQQKYIMKYELHDDISDVCIIPVTGRGPLLATAIIDPLNLPRTPAGYHHGAYTVSPDGVPVLNLTISMDVVEALVEASTRMATEKKVYSAVIAQCLDAKFVIYDPADKIGRSLTAERYDMAVVSPSGELLASSGSKIRPAGRTATKADMREVDFQQIYQATILNAEEEPPEIIEWQKQVIKETIYSKNLGEFQIHCSGRYFIDTIHHKADKSAAIAALGDHLGFTFDNVIALGDNQNDISMIRAARLGVAMGNARDDVKALANHVTGHVSEGGWAQAVNKFVFQE